MARYDPTRHDVIRPWHASIRWYDEPGATAGSGRQYRIPGQFQNGGAVSGAGLDFRTSQRKIRDRLPGAGWEPHDQYGFHSLSRSGSLDQLARKRTGVSDWRGLGSATSSADGCVYDLLRKGFPSRLE